MSIYRLIYSKIVKKEFAMRKLLSIGIILLFIGMSISSSTGFNLKKQSSVITPHGNTLYVGGSGPGNYTKIQDAIDNSSDGDTVFVYNGTYYENVVVDESINLIGEDRNTTIIDGKKLDYVIEIHAKWVNVSGFTIRNSKAYWTYSGILVCDEDFVTIFGNNIVNNWDGIYFKESCNNIITNNNISNNTHRAIYFYNSSNNSFYKNIILDNHWAGVRYYKSSNNIIEKNRIINNNGPGIGFNNCSNNQILNNTIINSDDGIRLSSQSNAIITGNIIINPTWEGIILEYSLNCTIFKNKIIKSAYCGIYIGSSSEIFVKDNIIYECYDDKYAVGIILARANNNRVLYNKIINNVNGIVFINSSFNYILENDISNNSQHGIWFWPWPCENNKILGNKIVNNSDGIAVVDTIYNNSFYYNNFIDNTNNTFVNGDNIWDDGKYGNYWSDYKDRYPKARKKPFKGIWDTPYEIPGEGNNNDNCPLINQWPNSKSRTITRNTASYSYYFLRFLEQFPLLDRLF